MLKKIILTLTALLSLSSTRHVPTAFKPDWRFIARLQPDLDSNGFGFMEPGLSNMCDELTLWATRYHIVQAAYAADGICLRDKDGHDTGARLSLCDWCDAALCGTVATTDSLGAPLILSFAGKSDTIQADCEKCEKFENYRNKGIRYSLWAPVKGRYGNGAMGMKLVPYRSIAVDRTQIPIGSILFIPDAVGTEITLPDGSISKHDGYFIAADTGGSIRSNQIDVFTGFCTRNPFAFVQSDRTKTFRAYIITDPVIEEAILAKHGV
ncbi:MAG: hypothetical protein LBR06_09670 [Bacteroidales bacterium]|jgi:3D (Asp-Asp-Asp) domain-containing protein|nr:hypothetical protein [Bacteroidales bacterium]